MKIEDFELREMKTMYWNYTEHTVRRLGPNDFEICYKSIHWYTALISAATFQCLLDGRLGIDDILFY